MIYNDDLIRNLFNDYLYSMVSCQKGPTRHAYAWQMGPFWQDTLVFAFNSWWPYDEPIQHYAPWSILVQVIIWCLLSTKSLSEPMLTYCQLGPEEQSLLFQENELEKVFCKTFNRGLNELSMSCLPSTQSRSMISLQIRGAPTRPVLKSVTETHKGILKQTSILTAEKHLVLKLIVVWCHISGSIFDQVMHLLPDNTIPSFHQCWLTVKSLI